MLYRRNLIKRNYEFYSGLTTDIQSQKFLLTTLNNKFKIKRTGKNLYKFLSGIINYLNINSISCEHICYNL